MPVFRCSVPSLGMRQTGFVCARSLGRKGDLSSIFQSPLPFEKRRWIFHSSRQTRIANPGMSSCSLSRPRLHLAFPSSQSVRVTTLLVLSKPLFSSACSIVWLAIRPFESKVNMKSPLKPSSLLRLKMGFSPPNSFERPPLMPPFEGLFDRVVALDAEAAGAACSLLWPFFFGSVFHRTTNFSSPRSEAVGSFSSTGTAYEKPVRTIFSDTICSLTLPTMGTQPQATGAVHSAAR